VTSPLQEPSRAAFVLSSGRCGSTLMSRVLRDHPRLLSLSEVFSAVGPATLAVESLSGSAFWQRVRHLDPDLERLLRSAPVPEAIGLRHDSPPGGHGPLSLATLPGLSLSQEEVLPHRAAGAQRPDGGPRRTARADGQGGQSPAVSFRLRSMSNSLPPSRKNAKTRTAAHT
jgi:hypothetical protein